MKKETIAIVVFALVVVGVWAWLEFRPTGPVPGSQNLPESAPAGRNVLMGATVIQRDWAPLAEMSWEDIAPTAAYLAENGLLAQRFIEETGTVENAPARYLRGMVLLGQEKPPEALAEFAKVPTGEIPLLYLYAPWRLQLVLQPNQENPYSPALFTAADEEKLPPLIAARVWTVRAEFSKAIENYLRADPAGWATVDLENFRLLMADEAYRNDAGTLLLGAMKAGTVPEALRAESANLLLGRTPSAPNPEKIREFFETNPEALKIAEEVLRSLLEDRALFVQEKFSELVARHEKSIETEQIDESVLLLVLAAAAVPDQTAFDRWSQELRRRFPQPEVAEWIESLKNP